jgi:hypothetical protein
VSFFRIPPPTTQKGGAERAKKGRTNGSVSRYIVLRSWTHFRRYGGHRVSISCIAQPDSFPAEPRASGPVFIFCAPGLVCGGTEGVGSRFHVLRAQNHFWRYRERPIPFSCFPLSDMFLVVRRAAGPLFMVCASGLVFGGTEGAGSRFQVLRSRSRFPRY